ncbi:MAG: hypothetical protein DHS80DRAFT_31568 [Piptocephalis tieghemiana]|nr:MAG: hypothetical protein DHS80DRAFT_31568 [Piptocephalis tieghemiana]
MSSIDPSSSPRAQEPRKGFQTRNRMDLRLGPTTTLTVILFLAPEHTEWFTQMHLQQLPALLEDEREGIHTGLARIWRGDTFVSSYCLVPSGSTCRLFTYPRGEDPEGSPNASPLPASDSLCLLHVFPKEFHALVEPAGNPNHIPLMPHWRLAYPRSSAPGSTLRQTSLI